MKTRNIYLASDNFIALDVEIADINLLKSDPALASVGLEVKEDKKINPLIIVHDIPVEYSRDEVLSSFIELNLPAGGYESEVKLVYLYPAGKKKYRSGIFEITPKVRKHLEKCPSIYIRFSSCKFSDHVAVLQCFKYLQFGHLAADCDKSAKCKFCAGDHSSDDCKILDKPRCANCVKAGHSNVAHFACDRGKCPLIRARIERKIARTDYGSE